MFLNLYHCKMMNDIWDFKVVITSFSLYMNKIDVQDYDLYNLISSISKRKRTQYSSAVVSLDAQKNPRKGKGNPPPTIDQPKIERERERGENPNLIPLSLTLMFKII